jgi:hypothetical protein
MIGRAQRVNLDIYLVSSLSAFGNTASSASRWPAIFKIGGQNYGGAKPHLFTFFFSFNNNLLGRFVILDLFSP